MNFGKNLLKYANSMNITVQKELAKKLKESEKTISSYTNERSYPTYKKLVKLCNLLKCDPNTLMEGDFETNITIIAPKLNPEDQYIIDRYKSLTPHDREIVDHIFKMKPEEPTIIYRFPVFRQEAAAGVGRLDVSDGYSMENFTIDNLPNEAAFIMEIAGESMYDEKTDYLIHTGSRVLIDPQITKYSLDETIVIANFRGKTICKRYIVKDSYILFQSDNDAFENENRKSTDDPDHKVIGVVLGVIENEKFVPIK